MRKAARKGGLFNVLPTGGQPACPVGRRTPTHTVNRQLSTILLSPASEFRLPPRWA